MQVAERLRERIELETGSVITGITSRGVTVSVGVAAFPDDGTRPKELFNVVDGLLYKAKECGKNKVYHVKGGGTV